MRSTLLGDREFTSEEVATLCGVTRVTVADWIARGKIDVRWTSGGHRRIPRASLAEFMARQGYALPRIVADPRALVLLIDDEPQWHERVRAALSTDDFEVLCLRPGIESVLAIGAHRPDVLLIDTRMPGFDALQLMESVRGEAALRDTVLVALTSFDEEVSGAKRSGAAAALPKARTPELATLLARILIEEQRRALPQEAEGREGGDADGASERHSRRVARAPRERIASEG